MFQNVERYDQLIARIDRKIAETKSATWRRKHYATRNRAYGLRAEFLASQDITRIPECGE